LANRFDLRLAQHLIARARGMLLHMLLKIIVPSGCGDGSA
jgi:hypothetical protein